MPLIYLGILVLVLLASKALLTRIGLPPIAGYLLLGWIARLVPEEAALHLKFLAQIGIVLLLFHIGLESHLSKLLHYIRTAGLIALCEVALTFALGFTIPYFFGIPPVASILIGLALSATSIGVSTASWSEKELATESGSVLLDLATIDDISGIFLMAVVFGIVGLEAAEHWAAITAIGGTLVGLIALIAGVYLFSHFAEPVLTKELVKYEKMPDSMLSIISVGLLIAGIAAAVGFSVAIGAFLAGIAFSRDPKAVRMNISMRSLLDLFVPFFFFYIGYRTSLTAIGSYWPLLLALAITTILAKFFGTYLPARLTRLAMTVPLAISMIPRAEVTMVIMEQALGLNLVTDSLYSVVSVVAFATCLIAPIGIRWSRPAHL